MINENSLGQPIAQDEESLKRFWNWFGNSKVVDEQGRPLVVYHGSSQSVDVFKPQNNTGEPFPDMVYATNNIDIAQSYTFDNVYELYLKMENPLVLDADGQTYNDFYDDLYFNVHNADLSQYDGIIIENIIDDFEQKGNGTIATTFAVFDSKQIKSIDNKGNWDLNNPNIYEQINEVLRIAGVKQLNESEDYLTLYRGFDKRYDNYGVPPKSNHIWTTDDLEYAQEYYDTVVEFEILYSALKIANIYDLENIFDNYDASMDSDNWIDFDNEQFEQIKDAGYNCFIADTPSGYSVYVILDKSLISSARIISKETNS